MAQAFPSEIMGKVVAVIDGNTVEFKANDDDVFRLVLSGIDSPELNQEFGEEAKRFLEKLLVGESATVIIEGKDRVGNRVGTLTYRKDKDPRLDLLEKGFAWTAEKNPKPQFEALREAAKSKAKGLWKSENPIPPWVFRRQQTMLVSKSS